MKKLFALLLVAVMGLSLVACGGDETSTNNGSTSAQAEATTTTTENQDPTNTAAPTEPTETETTSPEETTQTTEPEETTQATEPEETETTSPVETTPAFDTSWASNDFEALLPKLPFDGWTTKQKNDSVYEMELGGLKDQVITDDSGNTIGYGEDKEMLIAYLESLKDYGFSVEETGGIEGYAYQWLVIDSNGNQIEVVCAEGYCWITITKK